LFSSNPEQHLVFQMSNSIGATPLATFPNEHFKAAGAYAKPMPLGVIDELRRAVTSADWAGFFAEGRMQVKAEASWSASALRCERLKGLCRACGAERILEIGGFCGVASLSMAEVLPEDGEVISLELDRFVVDFGEAIKAKSDHFQKITNIIGQAKHTLDRFVERAKDPEGAWQPFNMIILDADKAGMLEYLKCVLDTPGMLSEGGILCMDVTPFKGQLFTQYIKAGKPDEWMVSSGQDYIDKVREYVKSLPANFHSTESGCLLVMQKLAETTPEVRLNLTIGANPLSAFPNAYAGASVNANWAQPRQDTPVEALRTAVAAANWMGLFAEGKTKVRAECSWSATEARCRELIKLCMSMKARRVLEVGSFCGVAALEVAESLPAGSEIVSLEFDPFFAQFGSDIKARSEAHSRMVPMTGPAKDSLDELAQEAMHTDAEWTPFDVAIIDADKEGITEYFKILWDTPSMMCRKAAICVDTTPFKGQLFHKHVKHGKFDDWVVMSGQESINSFQEFLTTLSDAEISHSNGLTIVHRKP